MVVTFPDSPFRLNQLYEPAGDQPEAIAKLVEGIRDGLAFQTLLGVTEAQAELRFSKSGETGVGVPARVKPLTTFDAAGASVAAGGPYEMSP